MSQTKLSKQKTDDNNWENNLKTLYESNSCTQFIISGNINDLFISKNIDKVEFLNIFQYLCQTLLKPFDLVMVYDLGIGLRIDKGKKIIYSWPSYPKNTANPKDAQVAINLIDHYFRYLSNLRLLDEAQHHQTAIVFLNAELYLPSMGNSFSTDMNALANTCRNWSQDPFFTSQAIATFFICEKINDLHPIISSNPSSGHLKIPLPDKDNLTEYFSKCSSQYPTALKNFIKSPEKPTSQLVGASLRSIERLLKTNEHKKKEIQYQDLSLLKKQMIERECGNLIEFIEPNKSLDNIYGHQGAINWMRQDIKLWQNDDLNAMPMGYLFCGPVGTGKTYLVECLAGSAGVPVVKMKNFRDRWVGSTEGNLEKIFDLLQALGKCIVFIDEADQALGKRSGGSNDSGVSGRVYSMMAKEMSKAENRGKILWILASSRPDLIEVDLKRPGRVDVKMPLFPTSTAEEGFNLIRALCKKHNVKLPKSSLKNLKTLIPNLITPGAAETIATKTYRLIKTSTAKMTTEKALKDILDSYQNPVPTDILNFQIEIAIKEASDIEFIPKYFRDKFLKKQ